MLPSPAHTRKRLQGGYPASLRQRSRITNLGVILLVSLLSFSLFLNLRQWLTYSTSRGSQFPVTSEYIDSSLVEKNSDSHLISQNEPINAKRLIIVAGHAIWKGCLPERRLDHEDWVLEPYQRGTASVGTFVTHITTG